MRFWDASAIIPLCVDQPGTPSARELLEEDSGLVAWWGTPVECCSAFARLRREDLLTEAMEGSARELLHELTQAWTEVQPGRQLREGAERALLLHPLRAADALQLAAALVWARGHGPGLQFVCADRRLADAARREGFTAVVSGQP